MIQENGLVIVDNKESEDEDNENIENGLCHRKRVLVSTEAAELLETAGKGSLGILINNSRSQAFIT